MQAQDFVNHVRDNRPHYLTEFRYLVVHHDSDDPLMLGRVDAVFCTDQHEADKEVRRFTPSPYVPLNESEIYSLDESNSLRFMRRIVRPKEATR